MFKPDVAAATAKYVNRLAEALVNCVKNDEPEKAAFIVYMLDQAVSPDKPIGLLLLRSMLPIEGLLALADHLPQVPELRDAHEELQQFLDDYQED